MAGDDPNPYCGARRAVFGCSVCVGAAVIAALAALAVIFVVLPLVTFVIIPLVHAASR